MRWAPADFVAEELNLSTGAGSAFSAASGSSASKERNARNVRNPVSELRPSPGDPDPS